MSAFGGKADIGGDELRFFQIEEGHSHAMAGGGLRRYPSRRLQPKNWRGLFFRGRALISIREAIFQTVRDLYRWAHTIFSFLGPTCPQSLYTRLSHRMGNSNRCVENCLVVNASCTWTKTLRWTEVGSRLVHQCYPIKHSPMALVPFWNGEFWWR